MNKKKDVIILGSTGSIGRSTLDVIRLHRDKFRIRMLTCDTSAELLEKQIAEFAPEFACLGPSMENEALRLNGCFPETTVRAGDEATLDCITQNPEDIVVVGISGAKALSPVFRAIETKRTVALANKECLVLAGRMVMKAAESSGATILPVDSEHNAVYQCMQGNRREDISHITLTASGGPFLNVPASEFDTITPEQALKHPNWDMGMKITIDSATMMNKALEIIEAHHIFALPPGKIKVVVHPQSLVHSFVSYKDKSVIAQVGSSDMRIPISYCLGEDIRLESGSAELNLPEVGQLTFLNHDSEKFPTPDIAYRLLEMKDSAAGIVNGANEIFVEDFLNHKIRFSDIFRGLSSILNFLEDPQNRDYLFDVEDISTALRVDQIGRSLANEIL